MSITTTERGIASEAFFIAPGVQWTDFITFFKSFIQVLNDAEIFGPSSVDFVVWQDSEIKWPVNPPPFALIEPTLFPWATEGIGGGRWTKTYTSEFKIHIIVQNIYDISYKDTNLVTSISAQTGPYKLVDQVINAIEQSYPTDSNNMLTLVELPYATKIDDPKRYKGSNEYSDIQITFYVELCEKMLSNVADAMPT
jgi:hypothetical protein